MTDVTSATNPRAHVDFRKAAHRTLHFWRSRPASLAANSTSFAAAHGACFRRWHASSCSAISSMMAASFSSESNFDVDSHSQLTMASSRTKVTHAIATLLQALLVAGAGVQRGSSLSVWPGARQESKRLHVDRDENRLTVRGTLSATDRIARRPSLPCKAAIFVACVDSRKLSTRDPRED